jgi:putative ABC transport system permease protein
MFDSLRQDTTHAVRGLIKSPGFAAAALITLALGIGATSAIFSVVKAVLITPLPYAAPERIVQLFTRWTAFDKTWLADQEVIEFRQMAKTVTAIGSWTSAQQNLTGDGEPLRVGVGFVTANLFDVLGVRPRLGRNIAPEEDVPNGPQVAILGYPLWQARYGGDSAIVGRTVLINDVPVQIIGVMPEGFRLPTDFTEDAAEPTQLWRPMRWDLTQLSRNHGYYGVAMLAPGQSAATVTEELRAICARLTEQGAYPPQMQFSAFAVPLDDEIRGAVRPAMWLLIGAVAFLLLIACANVANLLLVRGDARLREMAVRTAVGAAPDRLVRQLLTESVVLAVIGAALGLVLAGAGLRTLIAIDPTSLPPLAPVRLDWVVVAFTLALGVITTIVFGLVPALRTLRVNLVESLREGGQATVGGHRQRLRSALVIAEMTLAVVLVIGAGLMVRSLSALGRIDLGFNPENVLTLRISVPNARYDTPERVIDFYRTLNERVRALPGVQSAGFMRILPLATTIGDFGLDVEGFEETPGNNAKGDWQIATDGAFEAMGMRLIRGRWFSAADTQQSQPVAVINETMARTYWKDPADAIGGHIKLGGADPKRPWVTIVGMVADERHNGVTGIVKEKFYIPHSQWHVALNGGPIRAGFLVVRTTGDPMAVAGDVRSTVRALDGNIPVSNVRPMTEVVSTALATPRLTGFLLGTFAAIALTLAAVGIYGVLSYLVSRRTHEIGIRLAVGANRTQVLRMVMQQALTLAAAGIVAGMIAALLLTQLMQSLLYEVRPADPLTFAGVAGALIFVALLAGALPAYRATRVSPMIALRTE